MRHEARRRPSVRKSMGQRGVGAPACKRHCLQLCLGLKLGRHLPHLTAGARLCTRLLELTHASLANVTDREVLRLQAELLCKKLIVCCPLAVVQSCLSPGS